MKLVPEDYEYNIVSEHGADEYAARMGFNERWHYLCRNGCWSRDNLPELMSLEEAKQAIEDAKALMAKNVESQYLPDPKPATDPERLPWGVHTIASMFARRAEVSSPGPDGRCLTAVSLPYPGRRWEAAWWVLTGRAYAVVWPRIGDLEHALGEYAPK